jgi:hypothetical protein
MDTLIVGAFIGIVATLIGTWFDARYKKSTDTRTQLLLNMDDWVNDMIQACNSLYWKTRTRKPIMDTNEVIIKLSSERWIGVAGGLKIKPLSDKLIHFTSVIIENFNMYVKYIKIAANIGNIDEIPLDDLYKNLNEITLEADDIHKIITIELLRILPSWPERVWLWIKGKIKSTL